MARIWIVINLASMAVSVFGATFDIKSTWVGWLIPLVFGSYALSLLRPKRAFLHCWLIILLYLIIYAFFYPHNNSVQRTAILVTPFLVGLVASSVKLNEKDILFFWRSILAFTCFFVVTVYSVILSQRGNGLLLLAPESILAVALMIITLNQAIINNDKKLFALVVVLFLIPILCVSRTAVAVSLFVIMFSFTPIRKIFRLMSILLILIIGVYVANSTSFKHKMFLVDASYSDLIHSPVLLRTSGRIVAWQIMINEWSERPILGHGSNASEERLVLYSAHFKHPHNDWLRILYDYGLLGVLLFLSTYYVQLKFLIIQFIRERDDSCRQFLVINSLNLFMVFFLFMVTDNIVLYAAFFGNLHFLFIGFSYALPRSCHEEGSRYFEANGIFDRRRLSG